MTGSGFIYEQVAERIEVMIRDGVLQAGDKAPSLRKMSKTLDVSLTSVMKAYTLLEDQGLIQAMPQSGFYVRRAREWTEEPPCSNPSPEDLPVDHNRLIASFLENIQEPRNRWFSCATPDMSLLPSKKLGKLIAEASRDGEDLLNYIFPPGDEHLRRLIARRATDTQCSFSPNDVVITNGCLDALNMCLATVASPGDAIAIESPTYFGLLQAIENRGMRAVEIPTHPRTGVELDPLESVLKKKAVKACLFVTNFNNPLGSMIPDEKKQRLAEMLVRYQIPLIEDNVYGELYFGTEPPKPVKAFDKDGLVLLCSSYSKSLSPGLRLGYVASERYAEAIKELHFMTNLAAPSLSQRVVSRFLENQGYDRHLRGLRKTLQANINRTTHIIRDCFPKGTRVTTPLGGFVLWVALPEDIDALELYARAATHRLSFAPGPLFSARRDYRNCMRITCGYPWSPELEAGLVKLGGLACDLTA